MMSIVIPAGHLEHTVITVRCDSPHTAPHIECGLDGHSSLVNAPGEHPISFRTLTSNGRPLASSSSTPASWSSPLSPQADLSVERGMDHRGHYVRLSFLPQRRTPHSFGQRPFEHEITNSSLLTLSDDISSPAQSMASSQVNTSFRTAASASPISSPPAYSSMPIINNMHAEPNLENINFMYPSDTELMTALDSFMGMGIFEPHNSDYSMLDANVPNNIASPQALSQPSEPASPDMSSSSSSSGTQSPTTPYDFFLPAATPIHDGGIRNDIEGAHRDNHGPGRSLQASPVLPHFGKGSEHRATPPSKTESRLLPCPQPGCKRQFKSTSTLGGHMKTHAGKGVRFPCSFPPCTEKFSRRHDQLRHEVYKHGKQCEWVCSRCNSFFSYERSLEKHICTMDKSRRGSMPYQANRTSGSGSASGAAR